MNIILVTGRSLFRSVQFSAGGRYKIHTHPDKHRRLRRLYAGTIGISPLRYATGLRMHLASQWLNSERLPIETVAQRPGYTSQAAFSRAFKRITGQPPGASRQALKNQ